MSGHGPSAELVEALASCHRRLEVQDDGPPLTAQAPRRLIDNRGRLLPAREPAPKASPLSPEIGRR